MSDVPEAAVEAAAKVIGAPRSYDSQCDAPACSVCTPTRDKARAAIEAAMPAIREAIAQEIETSLGRDIRRAQAVAIVRGGTP